MAGGVEAPAEVTETIWVEEDLLDRSKRATHWGCDADLDRDGLPTIFGCAFAGDPFLPDPQKGPQLRYDEGGAVFFFRQRGEAVGTPGLDSTA